MNIRVPLKLIKTGIKLSTVLPSETNAKLADKGIDLSNLGDLQGEELIEALRDLQVDVDADDGTRGRGWRRRVREGRVDHTRLGSRLALEGALCDPARANMG